MRFFRRDVVVGLNPDVVVDPELPPVPGLALLDASGAEVPFQLIRRGEGYDITYSHYNYPRQTFADTFRVLVDARDVPPLGFRGFRIEKRKKIRAAAQSVQSGKNFVENQFLRVTVDSRGVRDLANDRILIDVNYHHLGAVADVQAAPRRINGKEIPPAVATNRHACCGNRFSGGQAFHRGQAQHHQGI